MSKNSKNRFDLEQGIMECWNICDDIKVIQQTHELRPLNADELLNALNSLETIYQMKFELLFNVLERMIRNGQIK
jgi:hypothetical protein